MPDKMAKVDNKPAKLVGRPYKYKTVDEFEAKWNEYLQDDKTTSPRITQFCIYADISPETFDSYKNREGFIEPIKKMLAICEDNLIAMLHDNNRRNIIGPIFALKNCFGWKDKQEIDTNMTGSLSIRWESDDDDAIDITPK